MAFSIKSLFGGGPAKDADETPGEGIEYNGYTIHPTPKRDGANWLTAGVIRKTAADGSLREHRFIRADTHSTKDDAASLATEKARRIIDEQGDRLFDADA